MDINKYAYKQVDFQSEINNGTGIQKNVIGCREIRGKKEKCYLKKGGLLKVNVHNTNIMEVKALRNKVIKTLVPLEYIN